MIVAARRANLGARLSIARSTRDLPLNQLAALERRCEALEAAMFSLARLVDEVDDLARHAIARAEAA
jgi:hypothetical protein